MTRRKLPQCWLLVLPPYPYSTQSTPVVLHYVVRSLKMQWLYSTESHLTRSTRISGLKPVINGLVAVRASSTIRDGKRMNKRHGSAVEQWIACNLQSSMSFYLLEIPRSYERSTTTLPLLRLLSSHGFSTLFLIFVCQ